MADQPVLNHVPSAAHPSVKNSRDTKITDVVCHVLLDPGFNPDATSSAQDDLIVEVRTDEGIIGIGQTDTNPWVARACIESIGTHTMGLGLKEMLLGADPMDTEAIWEATTFRVS